MQQKQAVSKKEVSIKNNLIICLKYSVAAGKVNKGFPIHFCSQN